MKIAKCFLGVGLVAVSLVQVSAQVFTDNFESYNLGPLDKNMAGGPNVTPNGSGNPWFGANSPNVSVVGAENGVTPHDGTQMVAGTPGFDVNQSFYNMAYHLGGGSAVGGNVTLSWWFYDALGSGGTALKDFIALGKYSAVPAGTDYPALGDPNPDTQRLSLGASPNQTGAFDSTKYQVRVEGAVDGYSASGWFNTTVTRSVGWHEGKIVVGPTLGDGTATVSFFIDNMSTPVFTHNSVTPDLLNTVEIDTNLGTQTGYFDGLTLTVPEPTSMALLLTGVGAWLALRRRK